MTTFTRRLFRLESLATLTGCRVCRHWIPATVCDETGVCLRPDDCPNCDRLLPGGTRLTLSGIALGAV